VESGKPVPIRPTMSPILSRGLSRESTARANRIEAPSALGDDDDNDAIDKERILAKKILKKLPNSIFIQHFRACTRVAPRCSLFPNEKEDPRCANARKNNYPELLSRVANARSRDTRSAALNRVILAKPNKNPNGRSDHPLRTSPTSPRLIGFLNYVTARSVHALSHGIRPS